MRKTISRFQRIKNALHAFGGAKSGNVAITFAFVSLSVIGGVGAAVDYSRANSMKAAMQNALDATALMLAREAAGLSASDLQTHGTNYFLAQFTRPEAKNRQVVVTANTDNTTILLNGSAAVDTAIIGVVGIKTITINGSSTATWGKRTRLRVALALDNTGSMAQSGKMPALQTAAKNLLARLNSAATTNGDVYVSIIPFATDVNVGSSNYTANWIDWSDWDDNNGQDTTTTTCSSSRTGRNGRTSRRCTTSTTWVPNNHNTWNGCITDRDQSYDVKNTPANPADVNLLVTTPSTLFPADQDSTCPVALLAPSYNWSAMTNLINSMTPNGTTNQAIGLAWGWLSLTQGSVLNPPAKDSSYAYADHIILLTDGLNTQDRWYTDQASIDARQKLLCSNIKNAGITLWTIQVNTGGDPTSTLLQQCATDSSKFFLLTTADQIVTTFDNISFQITQLHLSK